MISQTALRLYSVGVKIPVVVLNTNGSKQFQLITIASYGFYVYIPNVYTYIMTSGIIGVELECLDEC